MKSEDQTLQIEITIAPAKGRKGGRRRSPGAEPKVPDPPRIPRITRLMALALKFQDMVDRGVIRDYADLARLGYVSRARLTQIMNLLLLAPNIQESLLDCVGGSPVPAPSETQVRSVTAIVSWEAQQAVFNRALRWASSSPRGAWRG
jgi:hypothetical protein